MQFENLTPFHSMAFLTANPTDHFCTTVVIKVGYGIVIDPETGIGELHLLDEEPLPLILADEHWDDDPQGSIKHESDLAPFKPQCDVLIQGHAWAPDAKPTARWPVRVRVTEEQSNVDKTSVQIKPAPKTLVDKTLYVCPPGQFQKRFLGWTLTRDKNTLQVPLRWDYAFGGASQVANPKHPQDSTQAEWLLNEVCFSNPVGCGWIEKRHDKYARQAKQPTLSTLAAPSFFYPHEAITEPVLFKHPKAVRDAKHITDIAKTYPCRTAGLGAIGRHWAPRVSLTGTYDDQWEQERWPLSPKDFDEHYWNCAPQDQQCPWPAANLNIETWFLFSPAVAPRGYVQLQLPGHKAFVMLRLHDNTPIPLAANIDTLIVDTDTQQLSVVWRCRIQNSPAIKSLAAEFELDPTAPLVKYATTHSAPLTPPTSKVA